jgi:hypothetical protein
MGKGFGIVPPPKKKGVGYISTLSPEETQMVLAEMYDFLEREDHLITLGRMAIRRYANGEGRGAVVAAPWQHADPYIIPTHYMDEHELRELGLAYPGVLHDHKKYKPYSQFQFIFWKQAHPKTLAASQVIEIGSSLIKLFEFQSLKGQRG